MFRRNRRRIEELPESSTGVHAPDGIELVNTSGIASETEAFATIGRLFDVYRPGVVFSEPTTVGDHTVITAAEVHVGMGLGLGRGTGGTADEGGEGAGAGGGGGSAGRPIAAIIVSPSGVRVEPIVDVTKIALAFFTTLGAMYMSWRAMRRRT